MSIKYVETVGESVQDRLFKKDPWERECGRITCLACKTKAGRCMKKDCIYKFTCCICKEEGTSATYWGETARSMYERGVEHDRLMKAYSTESPMVEHQQEHHPEQELSFEMQFVTQLRRPLERQTMEGILIGEHSEGFLLNRKGEWGQNVPPKFGILEGEGNQGVKRISQQERGPVSKRTKMDPQRQAEEEMRDKGEDRDHPVGERDKESETGVASEQQTDEDKHVTRAEACGPHLVQRGPDRD